MSTPENSERISNLRKFASRLFKDGELIEYRAKCADGGMRGFYFTDLQRFAEVVADLDSTERALVSYTCLNPLKGRLIRERGLIVNPTDEQVNQILASPPGKTASNDDIDILRWIFIDVDTVRAPHLAETDKEAFNKMQHECSTDEEKAASKQVALKVLSYLRTEKGWPQPIICDSGNGWHLLFRMNLQNTPTNSHNHGDVLKVLKAKFDCSVANIDSTVYNPARLTRAYGSTTRKGTNTPERPYRPNYQIESKEPVADVALDKILNLVVESPGSHSRGSDDLPELDPEFKHEEWIKWYEDQGAFVIEGDKDWNGNPILATDFCLFAGRKHSGDEFKSGFVIGDTFGYKCFSDECEGKTIKDVFAYLRDTKNDDGSQKFKPFTGPIFLTEPIEDVLADFGAQDINKLDDEVEEEQAKKSVDASEPEQTVEPGEPDVNKKRLKVGRIRDLAGWFLTSIFRDPVDTLPKFRLLKGHIESSVRAQIEAPIKEVLLCLLGYFEDTHLLPTKAEMLSWMNESSHTVMRKMRELDYYDDIYAYVEGLQDDPSKEFTTMATELDRACVLAGQRKSTKTNFDKHLHPDKGDGDVQAFRIAERKFAQRELRSKGDIIGKPMQMVTDLVSNEFRKDVEGANDAGKVILGFPAIDEHSHIGLNGERTICFYGPANSGKTTLLMTVAVNMAQMGKNVLILIGEHQAVPMMKTLTLMLGPLVKDDPEIGLLPSRDAFEGVHRTATIEDWKRIDKLLAMVRERLLLPGWLSVENISALAGTEEDRLGACIDYMHSFHLTYGLDAAIIDPLDQVMPLSVMGKENAWGESTEILQRLQNLSRTFEGRNGKGLMIFTSAQFNSKMQREIEKNQAKTAIGDSMDDVIISLMAQKSQIQFYTTIPQHLDCMIGIVTRVMRGQEGYLVSGRFRFGTTFEYMPFVMDPVAHIITPSGTPTYAAPAAAAAAVNGTKIVEQSMEPFDTL